MNSVLYKVRAYSWNDLQFHLAKLPSDWMSELVRGEKPKFGVADVLRFRLCGVNINRCFGVGGIESILAHLMDVLVDYGSVPKGRLGNLREGWEVRDLNSNICVLVFLRFGSQSFVNEASAISVFSEFFQSDHFDRWDDYSASVNFCRSRIAGALQCCFVHSKTATCMINFKCYGIGGETHYAIPIQQVFGFDMLKVRTCHIYKQNQMVGSHIDYDRRALYYPEWIINLVDSHYKRWHAKE